MESTPDLAADETTPDIMAGPKARTYTQGGFVDRHDEHPISTVQSFPAVALKVPSVLALSMSLICPASVVSGRDHPV